jgi:hypothetical protein
MSLLVRAYNFLYRFHDILGITLRDLRLNGQRNLRLADTARHRQVTWLVAVFVAVEWMHVQWVKVH